LELLLRGIGVYSGVFTENVFDVIKTELIAVMRKTYKNEQNSLI
jgi:hypothetical protein